MIIVWRIRYRTPHDGTLLQYCTTKKLAEFAVAQIKEVDPEAHDFEIERFRVPTTKRYLVRWLNDHTPRTDNG